MGRTTRDRMGFEPLRQNYTRPTFTIETVDDVLYLCETKEIQPGLAAREAWVPFWCTFSNIYLKGFVTQHKKDFTLELTNLYHEKNLVRNYRSLDALKLALSNFVLNGQI